MSREELLAWVGIFIGIPSFLLLFFTGQVIIGIFVALIVGGLIWFRWSLNQPEFTLLRIEKTLTFHDPKAERATFMRRQAARANHKGLTEFWIRSISADGSIENIQIDGKAPDIMGVEAGDIAICKRFREPLERGAVDEMTVTYDIVNAFNGHMESTIHVVAYKTRYVRIAVETHKDRPIKSARAVLRYGGQKYKKLPQPKLSSNNCRAEMEVKRPKLGAEYYLEWDW
ncbi:MAG TPA: hypothetical protein VF658_15875 [Pyrinomonadaceae bacterium]|jgi:hypothetical protein